MRVTSATPTLRPRGARRLAPLAGLVLLAVVLGVGAGVAVAVVPGFVEDRWALWTNIWGTWVLVPAVVGAVAGRQVPGVVAAVVAELAMIVGYDLATPGPVSAGDLAFRVVCAVLGGALFGLAGAWWRSARGWRQLAGTALVPLVLVGEGMLRAVLLPDQGLTGTGSALLGVVLALVLTRGPRQRWALVGLLAGIVVMAVTASALADVFFTPVG